MKGDLHDISAMLTILVVDDNEGIRRGVKDLLDARPGWQVVGEAANGCEALEKATRLVPEVVILDISMPELDGISAVPLIRQALPQVELLVLSQHELPGMVARALDAGVRGYVLKSQASRDLLPAVEAASKHMPFFSREIAPAGPRTESGSGKQSAGRLDSAGPSKKILDS